MSIEEGYVYVLYNPMYEKYGEIYKIGQAKNISDRLSSYSTYYPEQSEIKYSIKHPYYKDLENNVINTSSGKLYSLLDNSINIKSFIYRVYLNTEDYIKLDKKIIDKEITKAKFSHYLLSYFN